MTIKKHESELKAISDIASANNAWYEIKLIEQNHKQSHERKSSVVSNQVR
jgi:hypothetical protein